MEEYLKTRHKNLNSELSIAKYSKETAPTLGLEKAAAMKIAAIEARIEEINKAQIQLNNETTN